MRLLKHRLPDSVCETRGRNEKTHTLRLFVQAYRSIAIGLVATLCLLTGEIASAHIVMGTRSLHLLVAEADVVVRARVIDPEFVFISKDGSTMRQLIEIKVLEELKGRTGKETLRFAQDGHDVARYAAGQEALFFLRPIAKSRELHALAVSGGPSYVSSQEHTELFLVEGEYGPALLSAARKLARSELAATTSERIALLRAATLELLTSGDPELGASGLASLVLTPQAALITAADLPQLEELIANRDVSVGLRAGLIAELERRGFIDGEAHWLALLEGAAPTDLPTAIRAAGAHSSAAVNAYLLRVLEDPKTRTEIAAECAIALGASHDVAAVGALTEALVEGEPRLRNAAIRGLGQIHGAEARKALEQAAQSHPDSTTRKRARAELRSATVRRAR